MTYWKKKPKKITYRSKEIIEKMIYRKEEKYFIKK